MSQVQTLVLKIAEASTDSGEREDMIARVVESLIPRAPWEDGICKTCGLDRDGENVRLCDKCDSVYHTYCLNPPRLQIPTGQWYCPSCGAGLTIPSSEVPQNTMRRYQGDFMRKSLEALTRLAKLVDEKDYLEFTLDEVGLSMIFRFSSLINRFCCSSENKSSHMLFTNNAKPVASRIIG